MKKFAFFLSLIFLSSNAFCKVKILTFHFNRPDFIEYQYKTFKKFLMEDHELIVFNDAREPGMEEEIRLACEKYQIPCIRYEQHLHETDPLNEYLIELLNDPTLIHSHIHLDRNRIFEQASVRHCHVIQYAMDHFGYDHNDILVIADGDVFPIRPIKLRELMKYTPMIGISRRISAENLQYMWVPFIACDMQKLPNKRELQFHIDKIGGYIHDTGAHSYYYMKNHPSIAFQMYDGHASSSFYNLSSKVMQSHGFNQNEIDLVRALPWPLCVEFHLEHRILHFGASSFAIEGHDIKSKCVLDFMKKILKQG